MAARRRGDQHGVDVVAGEDVDGIGDGDGCLQAFGQAGGGPLDGVRDRDQRAERDVVGDEFGVAAADPAGADEGDADRRGGGAGGVGDGHGHSQVD